MARFIAHAEMFRQKANSLGELVKAGWSIALAALGFPPPDAAVAGLKIAARNRPSKVSPGAVEAGVAARSA